MAGNGRWPTIGLLAGMGVSSTAPFLELVVDECRRQYGASHQPDYPQMIVFSWPTPFWVDRPVDHAAMRSRIAQGLRWLEDTGADFLAMPANFPHLYFDYLRQRVRAPLLNLVEAAVEGLPPQSGPVVLLATRPIRNAGIYQRAFERLGIETLADDDLQGTVDRLLGDVWAGRPHKELRARWTRLLEEFCGRASAALLACTDLNTLSSQGDPLPAVDITRLMASRVVSTWRGLVAERGLRPGDPLAAYVDDSMSAIPFQEES